MSNRRLESLDLLRGVAAFLVLAGHLRAFLFKQYPELDHYDGVATKGLVKAFYFLTGLGHQSVMIFFALSGFLVGGKVLDDLLRRRFSWRHYALRRLTRLWLVVIPILALTFVLDKSGLALTQGSGYDGRYYDMYLSGPTKNTGVDLSPQTLLGNVFFLQTITVPTFGSNSPMWSLANEFWYYVVFPLGAWLVLGKVPVCGKPIGGVILLFLALLLPLWLLQSGIVWMAGAVAAWCAHRPSFYVGLVTARARTIAIVVLMATLVCSKIPSLDLGDIGLGLIVALVLPVFANLPDFGKSMARVAHWSSEMSFTVYLAHFPFLAFVVYCGIAPSRWAPGFFSLSLYCGLLLLTLLWTGAIWWCFERNTDRLFAFLYAKLAPNTQEKIYTRPCGRSCPRSCDDAEG